MFIGLAPKELTLTFGALVLGGAISLLGYFGKRWIEGTSAKSKLERQARVLDLATRLKSEGLTFDDLAKLEELTSPR